MICATSFMRPNLSTRLKSILPIDNLTATRPRPRKTLIGFLVFVFCIAVFPQSMVAQGDKDLVHHGDIVDVDVVGGFEFDWRGTVSPEGFLDGLQNFGDPVYGLCRSETAIAADIAKAYSKILRDPTVVVRIIDRANRALVLLDGAVKMPQRFQLKRSTTLRELIVLSGGINDNASGEIQIFRAKGLNCPAPSDSATTGLDNASQTINISIKELLRGTPAANPAILSGDLITVSKADVVYVIGGVANPRQISARSQTTLFRAIASAGGLDKNVVGSIVTIFRRENGETKSIEVDLRRIETGEIVDPHLKAFDIVDVPVKSSQKRKYAPILTGSEKNIRLIPPLRIVD